jgi:hypothetical protein
MSQELRTTWVMITRSVDNHDHAHKYLSGLHCPVGNDPNRYSWRWFVSVDSSIT